MKYKILCFLFWAFYLPFYACLNTKSSIIYPIFKVDDWKMSNLTLFDSLAHANESILRKGLTNQSIVRKKILALNSSIFIANLKYVLNKNDKKKWNKMYIIINSFEGEVIIDITTFLFEREGEVWGYSYSSNLSKYTKVNKFNIKDIDEIRSIVHSSNNNLLILSKLNAKFHEIDKQILIGTGFREFQSVLNLYNKKIL